MFRARYAVLGAIAAVVLVAGGALFLPAWFRPNDSPMARMYRTEADLRSLIKAVDTYFEALGVYPEPGAEGLEAAIDHLSQNVAYFPSGPPQDAWGRPYVYVPHTAYEDATWKAVSDGGGYFAPEHYQVYSVGADGEATGLMDNINNWDADRSWRTAYKELQRRFEDSNGSEP